MRKSRNEYATEVLPSIGVASSEARKHRKQVAIAIVNQHMSTSAKIKFKQQAGATINRVLQSICGDAIEELIACGVHDGTEITQPECFDQCIERITEAWSDDTWCQTDSSGKTLRGYHRNAISKASAKDWIEKSAKSTTVVQSFGNPFGIIDKADTCAIAQVLANLRSDRKTTAVDWLPYAYNIIQCGMELGSSPYRSDESDEMLHEVFTDKQVQAHTEVLQGFIDRGDEWLDVVEKLDDNLQPIVSYIVDNIKEIEAHSKTKSMHTITVALQNHRNQQVEPTPIDPTFKDAVDTLLGKATGGVFEDIEQLMKAHADMQNETKHLTDEVERLKSASVPVAIVPTNGSAVTDAGKLTYQVIYTKAADIFLAPDGSKSRLLDFEIPTLVWEDADGNIVEHPECPAIDPNYQFREKYLVKFLTALKFRQNIWLHGSTGTGKTTMAEQVAARIGFPVPRLNLDSNIERPDIVGGVEIVVEDGAPVTKFKEGILTRAMQQPCIFVLDETDAGRPDVLFVIQRALEGKGLTVTEDGGRVVQQNPLFSFVATANSRGQGDEKGWYAGVRPLNLAFLNRFGAFIEIDYLDREDEGRLLHQVYAGLDKDEVDNMTAFTEKVRAAFNNGEVSQTISPRNLHAMAMYYLHYKPMMGNAEAMREAVNTTVIDSAPADNAERLRQIYERCF